MSRCAPTRELTALEHAAELRRVLAWSIDRIATGGGVVSCTGQDTEAEAALHRYASCGHPADLAAAHAATGRRVDGFL